MLHGAAEYAGSIQLHGQRISQSGVRFVSHHNQYHVHMFISQDGTGPESTVWVAKHLLALLKVDEAQK